MCAADRAGSYGQAAQERDRAPGAVAQGQPHGLGGLYSIGFRV